jgi:4-alpha-glucanotransferase
VNPRAWGIEPGYHDISGTWRETSAETTTAILEAMGARSERPPEHRPRMVRFGDSAVVGKRQLQTEDGGSETVTDRLPPDLPIGYHRLIDADGTPSQLIVTPAQCYLPDSLYTWGWAIQSYALRSARSWGFGDFADLRNIAEWAAGLNAGALVVNPFHSPEPSRVEDSPYFPGSRCYRNLLYLRIEEIPGAGEAGVDLQSLATAGRALNDLRLIDRQAVVELKTKALELLWAQFRGDHEFTLYCRLEGEQLDHFATFVTLAEELGPDWRQWPPELRTPSSSARSRAERERVDFHKWIQWLLDRQLATAGKPLDLINDLGIGVSPNGADVWMWSDSFAQGVTIGAPPDDFNLRGQGWGLTAFDPWRLRANGYEPFIRMIRSAFRHAGGFRYDHVMGLFRLFWIPEGAEPLSGAYVRYPHQDLLDILALESQRAGAVVIGEDLGTVEPEVRAELAARRVLSYRLMYFESDPPESYPECALAAITNHDLPTLPGLLSGTDLRDQERAGVEPNVRFAEEAASRVRGIAEAHAESSIEEVVAGSYRKLARSPARVVTATLEDALGIDERPNLPGTTSERPNWCLALPVTTEELKLDNRPGELAKVLHRPSRPLS